MIFYNIHQFKRLEGAELKDEFNAGETSICTVGEKSDGLHYRGYDVVDLSENCSFEEVVYLLLYKKLPNKDELRKLKSRLKSKRYIPEQLKEVLERIPKSNNPMDVLRTACSFLGNLEPEKSFDNQFVENQDVLIFTTGKHIIS